MEDLLYKNQEVHGTIPYHMLFDPWLVLRLEPPKALNQG